jgi:hypothetical protein
MATLTVQKISADAPIVPTFSVVTLAGDQFATTGKEFCLLQNLGNQSATTTFTAQSKCNQGFLHTATDSASTGIAQTSYTGPFDRFRFGDSNGNVQVTYAGATLAAPSAPSVSNSGTGGTVAAGTYQVEITYVNAQGETVGSASASTTTSGTTSTITITSPAAAGSGSGAATGWYAYVTQAGGSTYTRQQAAGSPTAIGTNLTLSAPPTSTGANPPASNTAVALFAAVISS